MKKLIPILAILYFGISISLGPEKQSNPALKPMTIRFIDSCKEYRWDIVKIKYQLEGILLTIKEAEEVIQKLYELQKVRKENKNGICTYKQLFYYSVPLL